MNDQNDMHDPTTLYPQPGFPEQRQNAPGLVSAMRPRPDHGEESYRGSGRLAGRRAIVTGADSGIGRAVAIAFAREGAHVAMSYLPAEESDARDVAQLIAAEGVNVVAIPGDLSDEGQCQRLVSEAFDELDGIDIVVNVAGKQQAVDDILNITTEQFDQTFKTNVYSMFWIIKAALPHLKPGAAIINTSSVQAYDPSPHLLDYAATKAAINNFSKGLAQQLAPKGIRVNVVAPGPVWTPLQVSGGQPTEKLPHFGESSPLGRAGQPAEVAPAYVFLASAESSYVSGETLSVTGGMVTP